MAPRDRRTEARLGGGRGGYDQGRRGSPVVGEPSLEQRGLGAAQSGSPFSSRAPTSAAPTSALGCPRSPFSGSHEVGVPLRPEGGPTHRHAGATTARRGVNKRGRARRRGPPPSSASGRSPRKCARGCARMRPVGTDTVLATILRTSSHRDRPGVRGDSSPVPVRVDLRGLLGPDADAGRHVASRVSHSLSAPSSTNDVVPGLASEAGP